MCPRGLINRKVLNIHAPRMARRSDVSLHDNTEARHSLKVTPFAIVMDAL